MSDASLRAAERDVAQGIPRAAERLAAERGRMGLCPDCGGTHRPPVTDCEDVAGVQVFGAHARGTRDRAAATASCGGCHEVAYARARASSGPPIPGPTRYSRAVIQLAMLGDPCPARRAKVILAAKPYPPGTAGSGWCNANACWYAERKKAIDRYVRRQYPPAAEDPRQLTMWENPN